MPRGARCVQRFDDSLNSAIHITYRISLRSSSMREPRYPLLKVVLIAYHRKKKIHSTLLSGLCEKTWAPPSRGTHAVVHKGVRWMCESAQACTTFKRSATALAPPLYDNDPSAGSPTETLLRLLLPLNEQFSPTFQQRGVVSDSPKPIRRSH